MPSTAVFTFRSVIWRATFLACALAVISYVFTDLLDLDGSNLLRLRTYWEHSIAVADAVTGVDLEKPRLATHLHVEPILPTKISSALLFGAEACAARAHVTQCLHQRRIETFRDSSSDPSPDH